MDNTTKVLTLIVDIILSFEYICLILAILICYRKVIQTNKLNTWQICFIILYIMGSIGKYFTTIFYFRSIIIIYFNIFIFFINLSLFFFNANTQYLLIIIIIIIIIIMKREISSIYFRSAELHNRINR